MLRFLKQIKDKKIILFGTGRGSFLISESLPFPIGYYVDNDINKWNQSHLDSFIHSPAVLGIENKDEIAILVACDYYKEISNQLMNMGFEKNKHFWNGIEIFGDVITNKSDLFSNNDLGCVLNEITLETGYLNKIGWIRSFLEKSVIDLEGNPIPWLAYPAIDFVSRRINSEMTVFEYGCGNSTLWWSKHVKKVISCEHDSEWFKIILAKTLDNVTLCNIDLEYGGAYSKKITEFHNEFDIIVIDGRDRVNCAINCLPALKTGGVIIWDNSERSTYNKGISFLIENGFRRIEFTGLFPVTNSISETSIFYRTINCFNI